MISTTTVEIRSSTFSWLVPVGSRGFLLLVAGACFSGSASLMISRSLKILVVFFFKRIELRKGKNNDTMHKENKVHNRLQKLEFVFSNNLSLCTVRMGLDGTGASHR